MASVAVRIMLHATAPLVVYESLAGVLATHAVCLQRDQHHEATTALHGLPRFAIDLPFVRPPPPVNKLLSYGAWMHVKAVSHGLCTLRRCLSWDAFEVALHVSCPVFPRLCCFC